jgi:hypothetical protein
VHGGQPNPGPCNPKGRSPPDPIRLVPRRGYPDIITRENCPKSREIPPRAVASSGFEPELWLRSRLRCCSQIVTRAEAVEKWVRLKHEGVISEAEAEMASSRSGRLPKRGESLAVPQRC